MIRILLAWSLFASAVATTSQSKLSATTSKGELTDALRHLRRSNLRAKPSHNDAEAVEVRAALQALLGTATDALSEAYYIGLSASLSQSGYEQSLGKSSMTAFITKYMESQGLTYTDADALAGFVMYYDGTCTKKSYDALVAEMAGPFVGTCHGTWIESSGASLSHVGRAVSNRAFKAMLLKESIMMRAAAFSAAGSTYEQGADSLTSLRKFIREYISELNGNILNEDKFDKFLTQTIGQIGDSDEPLEKLVDLLMEEAEKRRAFVEMPRLPSRTVKLLQDKIMGLQTTGIGSNASLDETGYTSVVATADNDQMVTFIYRVLDDLGLEITSGSETNLYALGKWYDSECATQSFAALQAELKMKVDQPSICGGGWVQEKASDEELVFGGAAIHPAATY